MLSLAHADSPASGGLATGDTSGKAQKPLVREKQLCHCPVRKASQLRPTEAVLCTFTFHQSSFGSFFGNAKRGAFVEREGIKIAVLVMGKIHGGTKGPVAFSSCYRHTLRTQNLFFAIQMCSSFMHVLSRSEGRAKKASQILSFLRILICFHFPHCAFPLGETYIERKGCGRQLG